MKPIRSAELKQTPPPYLGFDHETLLVAAREAVRQALADHKARGNSVVVWRDGRVVLLAPEEIEV
jgi:hypothetical protein